MSYFSALKYRVDNSRYLKASFLTFPLFALVVLAGALFLKIDGNAYYLQKRFEVWLCERGRFDKCVATGIDLEKKSNQPAVQNSLLQETLTQNVLFVDIMRNETGENSIVVLTSSGKTTYPLAEDVQYGLSIQYVPGSSDEFLIDMIAEENNIDFVKGREQNENMTLENDVALSFPVSYKVFSSVAKPGKLVNLLFNQQGSIVIGVALFEL